MDDPGFTADDPEGGARQEGDEKRLLVDCGGVRRPFMRGIMVHSLMARGVGFDDAYRTAEKVRERVADLGVVAQQALAKQVSEILGDLVIGESVQPPVLPGSIQVTRSGGRATPFSKGILAQSLLAASVDATDAFDAAREIERALLGRNEPEISRTELRRLSYRTLLTRFGAKTAERYRIWRRFQEPDKPVIILLGGTTGAGKTSLALEVARRLGIRRMLSTDSIRQIMRLMLAPDLLPALHVSSFDAHRHLSPPAAGGDATLEGFRAQASVVAVGVRAIIERSIAENASLVLDGVALVPGLLDLEAYAGKAHVIFLVVATLDDESFVGRFEDRGNRQTARETHRYVENLEGILKIQQHFLELADRHDVPIVDNASIDSSVLLILRHVVETLGKQHAAEASATDSR